MHKYNFYQKHKHNSTRGERIADSVVKNMGSWKFIIIQTVIVLSWILGNAYFLLFSFDKYPFILLNLLFSTQAAYASPLILMAANRTAQRDKAQAEHQYEHQEKELQLQTQILYEQNIILNELRERKR